MWDTDNPHGTHLDDDGNMKWLCCELQRFEAVIG